MFELNFISWYAADKRKLYLLTKRSYGMQLYCIRDNFRGKELSILKKTNTTS